MRADRFEMEDECPATDCGHLLAKHDEDGCTVGWKRYSYTKDGCMCNLRIAQ